MTTHGTLLKKLRLERNLSRARLIDNLHSISTLQRFENDEAKMNFDTMWHLLDRMNIQLDDYVYEYQHFQLSKKATYQQRLRQSLLSQEQTTAFLLELEQAYQETKDIFYLFLQIQVKAIATKLFSYQVPAIECSELEKVYHYLAGIERWGFFELQMYTHCLSLLSNRFRMFHFKDVLGRFQSMTNSSKHQQLFVTFLIHSLVIAFEEQQLTDIPALLSLLDDATKDPDCMKGRIYWTFFCTLYQSATGKLHSTCFVEIEILQRLGYEHLAQHLSNLKKKILAKDLTSA